MKRDLRGARGLLVLWCAVLAVLVACSSQDATVRERPGTVVTAKPATPVPRSSAVAAPKVAFDIQGAAQRARLAYRASKTGHEAAAPTHAVTVRNGLTSITPFHYPSEQPGGPEERLEGSPLSLETVSVKRGATRLAPARAVASVGSEGELRLARAGVTEVWKNSERGVEQSWRFAALPAGQGELVVRVSAKGQSFRSETPTGLHFSGTKHGLGLRYGHGTWIDGAGNRTRVPARWTAGAIELRVASSVVEQAVYPAVLDPTIGPEIGTDEPVSGPARSWSQFPRVATNSAGVSLIAWQANSDIYGVRLGTDGAVMGEPFPICESRSYQFGPAVAAMGTDWFVIWSDTRAGPSTTDIYGARVNAGGTVLDPDGIPIATGDGQTYYASLASDGTNWFAIWTDTRGSSEDLYAARIGGDGTVLDPTGILVSSAGDFLRNASVAYNGTNYLAAWEDARNGTSNYDIYGARVDPGGVVLDPGGLGICTQGSHQAGAFVSSNGTNWLVTWSDLRNGAGNFDILGTRVGADGAVLDGSGFSISTAAGNQGGAVSAHDGTNWLVAWSDPRNTLGEVYSSRVGNDGSVTDPSGVALPGVADASSPALSYDGTNWVLAWMGYPDDIYQSYAARLDSTLTALDAGTLLSVGPNTQAAPAASFDGTNWLVVWADSRSGDGDIYGARYASDGTLLDDPAIAIGQDANFEGMPAVDHDGVNWLVAWSKYSAGSYDLVGARVDATGTVLDLTPLEISSAAGLQQTPSISHDADNWLVVWDDSRNPGSGIPIPMPNNDVYGARVDPDGVVLDTSGIAIATETSYQVAPKVVHDGTNWLVVWQDARGGSYRIYGARVATDGAVLDPTGFAISNTASSQASPTLASDGSNTLVAWADYRNGNTDLYGVRVTPTGTLLDATDLELCTADSAQSAPSLAYSGVNWVLAWTDDREGYEAADLFTTDLDEMGVAADPEGVVVSNARYVEDLVHLAAGPTGNVLVAYATVSGANIRVKVRVGTTCTPIDTDDVTCDGIDDDCAGGIDDGFPVTPTTCGSGACQTTGSTSCVNGSVVDSCTPDPTDDDLDLVPNCADACPTVAANTSNGCPRKRSTPRGGSSNAGGEAGSPGSLPPSTGGTSTASGGRGGSSSTGSDDGGDGSVPASDGGAPNPEEGGAPASRGGAGGMPSAPNADAGDANAAGDGASPSGDSGEEDDSGCSCRLGSSGPAGNSVWLLAGTLVALTLGRRRGRTR
jgi:hypothetical protein